MFYISTEWIWIPVYGFFIYLIVKKNKKLSWLPIAILAICILLSDQTSGYIKKQIKRPRPTHDLILEKKVHVVNDYRGGSYGFVSSHAANTFCLALLLSLILEWSFLSIGLAFSWAALVSYSRIYLGVHFPLDIIFGAFLGMIIAFLGFLLLKKCKNRFFSRATLP